MTQHCICLCASLPRVWPHAAETIENHRRIDNVYIKRFESGLHSERKEKKPQSSSSVLPFPVLHFMNVFPLALGTPFPLKRATNTDMLQTATDMAHATPNANKLDSAKKPQMCLGLEPHISPPGNPCFHQTCRVQTVVRQDSTTPIDHQKELVFPLSCQRRRLGFVSIE